MKVMVSIRVLCLESEYRSVGRCIQLYNSLDTIMVISKFNINHIYLHRESVNKVGWLAIDVLHFDDDTSIVGI